MKQRKGEQVEILFFREDVISKDSIDVDSLERKIRLKGNIFNVDINTNPIIETDPVSLSTKRVANSDLLI